MIDVFAPPATAAGIRSRPRPEADQTGRPGGWPRRIAVIAAWVAGIGVIMVFLALLQAPTDSTMLGINNPGPTGARAIAEILRSQGVTITPAESAAAAIDQADANTTVAVVDNWQLTGREIRDLVDASANVVIIDPRYQTVDALDADVRTSWDPIGPTVSAACSDADATAAGRLTLSNETTPTSETTFDVTDSSWTGCFRAPSSIDAYLYATGTVGQTRVDLLGSTFVPSNDGLALDGNAALSLRLLGRTDKLIWLTPMTTDATTSDASVLPPTFGPLVLFSVVLVGMFILWRGRRFGRLVTEPLPVLVRGSETVLGQGRTYRRAGDRAHAAAGLRAGTASRLANALGIPRGDDPAALVTRIASATGRDPSHIHHLFYGPPPGTDAELLDLARHLSALEREARLADADPMKETP